MNLDTQVNTEAFERDAAAFAVAVRRPVSEVLRSGAKSAVKDLVKLTPPTTSFNPNESFAVQRRAGLAAIDREIPSAYVELESLSVLERPRNPDLADSLSQAVKSGESEAVRAILDNAAIVQVPAAKMLDETTLAHHQGLRNRRGKIPPQRRNHPFYVMRGRSLRRVIRERKKNVGTGKAGWAAAALALGVRLPVWISRQRKHGRYRDESRRLNNPSITLSNTVDFVARQDRENRFVRYALKNASRKIARQLDAKMKGLWGRK